MMADSVDKLRAGVRDVSDFPKKGIVFKDITPILSDHALFRASIDLFLDQCRGKNIDKIVGIDARGFLFGSTVAYELGRSEEHTSELQSQSTIVCRLLLEEKDR